jgi:phosphotransferase system  glucose/maltose/N-acetylglucosamine-specific IIC component
MSSIASKMGADGSKGLNPYAGRGVNPITWKEFIYTIPDSFLISIIFSLLFYLFISLGNKKNEQEKESEKNNE